METFSNIIKIIFKVIAILSLLVQSYYLFLSIFGMYKKKRKLIENGRRTFAVVIPAHNEEKVIENTVKSIQKLNYPNELYDIFVIADNCTDATAQLVSNLGANVFEREDKEHGGKGYALQYFFKKLFTLDKEYRSVLIVDADNILHPNFLEEMNKKMNQGYKVVQGFLDSKNAWDTPISAFYSIEFWATNRMLKLSRDNLGLSAQLGGTGFAVDSDILKHYGWDATCLTEDLEFTCKLVMNNYKVGWAHDAIIYDEKPLTLKASWHQRKRWMQGFADVYSTYFWPLMKKGFKDFDLRAMDCAVYTIQPILLIIFGINTVAGVYNSIVELPNVIRRYHYMTFPKTFGILDIILGILLLYQVLYVPIQMYMDKKLSLKSIITYIFYPFYSATWIPIAILGIIHRDKKEWVHTEHTRSIELDDIAELNKD